MLSRAHSRLLNFAAGRARRAFTLIELLVVIGILLTLATLALAVYNAGAASERTRSAARIVQSAFLGARDRASHARDLCGVRFVRDLTDSSLVTAFAYVAPLENRKYGGSAGSGSTIQILRPDANSDGQGTDATGPDAIYIAGSGVDWLRLDSEGFFALPTTRVRIPAGTGTWYSLQPLAGQTASPWFAQTRGSTVLLTLAGPFASPESASPNVVAVDTTSPQASCEIELAHDLVPFHQPIGLPSGVVIDLDWSSSNVQALWPANSSLTAIEIMFSPRGNVAGPVAAMGPLHFLLNDLGDAAANLNPIDPKNRGDKLVLSVFPQTGLVATFPIDPTDADSDGIADDLFHFARIGATTGQ